MPGACDAALLNSAAALFVAGKVKSLSDGWDLAVQLIAGGAAEKKLLELTRSELLAKSG